MKIDELLIEFDEMGFVPTTLCENPDEYASEWKKQLIAEIERLKAENEKRLTCDFVKTAQKQAVKEFAKKLKEKVHNYYPSIDSYCTSRHVILVKDIDELLKEYEKF